MCPPCFAPRAMMAVAIATGAFLVSSSFVAGAGAVAVEEAASETEAAPAPPPARAADPVAEIAFEDALPGQPTVDARLEEIRRRLQAALVYPPIARRIGLEGTAWLRFEIDREGAARDVAVARSSGHAVLDRAARQTVDRAGRLPWVYGQIEVPIRFSLAAPRS